MKKVISLIVILTMCLSLASVTYFAATDKTFTAFTSASDNALTDWVGKYLKTDNTYNNWVNDDVTTGSDTSIRLQNTAAGVTSGTKSGAIFYTKTNFGTEYVFTSQVRLGNNNQFAVYFNCSTAVDANGTATAATGYRLVVNNSAKTVKLQKCTAGTWADITDASQTYTTSAAYAYRTVTITVNGSSIKADFYANTTDGTKTITVTDASYPFGYIGFEGLSAPIRVQNINVAYNSTNVFKAPTLSSCSDMLKAGAYDILKKGETKAIEATFDAADASHITKCELYVDGALNATLAKDASNGKKYTGTLTAPNGDGADGMHTAVLKMTDLTGTTADVATASFYVADVSASKPAFAVGGTPVAAVGAGLANVVASMEFNPYDQPIPSVTMIAVVFNADHTISAINQNVTNLTANQNNAVTCTIPSVAAGQYVKMFLCESLAKPAPLSGGFQLN